jgi:hypothetical protein
MNCLEKSKNLHMRMILVYMHHVKNSSGFDKVLLHIHRKGIYGSYSPIWPSERFPDCEGCIVQFVEFIWNFYEIVMDPKNVAVWICGIFWPTLAITIIIYSITKE